MPRGPRSRSPLPEYRPQLALLVKAAPEGEAWLHELKLDGYRIGCRIEGARVQLFSRRGHEWTAQFPEVVKGARQLGVKAALFDGEVAAVLPDGRTSFQAMQRGWSGPRPALTYFVFDLLHLDGEDIGALPLGARKERLAAALGAPPPEPWRYVDHVIGRGGAFFAQACQMRLEGIVSKERAAPYKPDTRNGSWQKTKCLLRQELVVGGYEESVHGGLGALLLGYYDGEGRLVFSGKVGTGFQRVAATLFAACKKLVCGAPPFQVNLPRGSAVRDAHWMKPSMVVEVAFAEWTAGGNIRHPSFQGLRADKRAREVVREQPAEPPAPTRSKPRR